MTRKRFGLYIAAIALGCATGVAQAGYGDDRAAIAKFRAPSAPRAN